MRAAIYDPYWDTLGGGERYTATLVKLLLDKGWQVDIFWPRDISGEIKKRFGIDISGAKYISHFSSLNSDLVFWVSDGSLPVSLAKKTIIHFQFPFSGVNGKSVANRVKSLFYTFVVNSRFTKEITDREFGINSQVVYPPVDTALFSPGKKTKTILYVGRFSKLTQAKGHSFLIDTFRGIKSQIPRWQLILAGGTTVGSTPAQMQLLHRQASGLPIKIITNPNMDQLKKLYASASLFWSAGGWGVDERTSPTQVEHFGISVVEAMAAGCVPIITNLGGHREIVERGISGIFYDTPDQLQSETLRLINHPDQLTAMSAAAVSRSKIFDIKEFNRNFENILNL